MMLHLGLASLPRSMIGTLNTFDMPDALALVGVPASVSGSA